MIRTDDIQVIAFDADDTLWDCQSYFDGVEQRLAELLEPYCAAPREELFKTESANMADLGFGSKAFTISVIETALRMGGDRLTAKQLQDLLDCCRGLLRLPATPLPGVEPTLRRLRAQNRWQMVVFTKGELLDQQNKLHRSGLADLFSHVEITSNKTPQTFLRLCDLLRVAPRHWLMVGNSLRSDVAPALEVGAAAAYIPFHLTWQMEQTTDIQHDRLVQLKSFSDLLPLLGVS